MESCADTLTQPVEYINTICLDKGVILADGCNTATLTTENGESLPVTFIVSQHVLDDDNSDKPVQDVITLSDDDVSVIPETSTDNLDVENSSDGARTIYTIHFPSDAKNNTEEELDLPENGTNNEDKAMGSENSIDQDLLDPSDSEEFQSATNLEDFMDVVTTYKCKFCRFSCPWKSGLVSHIRCCHIHEKNIVTLKADKEPNIVTARKKEDEKEAVPKENSPTSSIEIKNVYSIQSTELHSDSELHQEQSKSPKSENDSDQVSSKTNTPILERHIYLCGQCSEGFMTLEDCKQHMIDDHNIKLEQNMIKPLRKRGRPRTRPYNDAVLGDGAEGSSKTKEAKRTSRPPKNLEDDYDFGIKKKPRRENLSEKVYRSIRTVRCSHNGCGHRFTSTNSLQYHYSCHAPVGKSFTCPECHTNYEHWRGVVMHLWKDHNIDIDLFSCTDCSYKTYSFFKLDNHKKIHSEERAFACQTCGKAFKQISQLRNHLVIHLDRKNLPEKRWYSEQECDICGRKFSDTKCLRKHQQAVHNKLKPFICSYCGHLSARKAMLELHMRQHTGEKPFACEHCDYRTGDHNSLRRHRMRHTGAKPYKCPHCPYACIQAISYKTHLRNKHPGMEGLFCCSMCTFKSVSKENYINHMSDHKRAEALVEESASTADSNSEALLESIAAAQSPVQMQLNDNALQQLEGILPGNITAAQLIFSCLNALSQDGGTVSLPPGVTVNIPPGSTNATDGTQTITIQLPSTQDMENEPYYFTIQQDGSTTALVLPSEQNEAAARESAEDSSTQDIDSVNFAEQDVSGISLDCNLPEEDENVNLPAENTDSLVITHIEPFDDDDPEAFTSAAIVDEDETPESQSS